MDDHLFTDASEDQNSVLSSADSDESIDAVQYSRSQLRPSGADLTFVPFADWESARTYADDLAIRYNVEWKVSVKNRNQAGESELDIMISPQKFWKHILRRKVANASAGKPWTEEKTKLVLSVTDHRTSKITKEFPKLEVQWSFVAKHLQEWSKFLNDGKKITVTITFYYKCVDTDKPGKKGATANQEADLEARTAGLGRGACIRRAYALVRCPGRPCTNGDHCWIYEGKHYPLQPHHVRILADHMQAGKALNGHDDVPENFRRLVMDDEREREQRQRKERRKRPRRDSDGSPASVTKTCCYRCRQGPLNCSDGLPSTLRMTFPTSPVLGLDLSREEAVKAYSAWQQSQVSTEEQRESYRLAEDLTLEHCIDLNMLASNQEMMYWFYKGYDIPEGVAWHYVCDIKLFMESLKRAEVSQ